MEETYTVKQMATLTGVSAHTLRYYEKINLLLDVGRDNNGYRRFVQADVEWINFLRELKATGMPLAQMQRFAELRRQGDETASLRRNMLERHRIEVLNQIEALNGSLAMIDFKIERHRQKEKENDP